MDRGEKAAAVAELNRNFSEVGVVVVTRNLGMTVQQSTVLRNRMREAGATYKVSKNKLARIALESGTAVPPPSPALLHDLQQHPLAGNVRELENLLHRAVAMSEGDELPVSEKAWRTGGSKMFVKVGTRVRVGDLIRGVIIQSGNDACVVVAEGMAGSEEAFARQMTAKGKQIGLTGSNFANANGLPDPNHWMTVRDLATLAQTHKGGQRLSGVAALAWEASGHSLSLEGDAAWRKRSQAWADAQGKNFDVPAGLAAELSRLLLPRLCVIRHAHGILN